MNTRQVAAVVFCLTAIGCGTRGAAPSMAPTTSRVAPVSERQLGMNLGGVVDYSSEWPFTDVFKSSRPWMEKGAGPFTYTDRGEPILRTGQSVETLLCREVDGHYPAGDYVCTYEGTGEIDISRFDVERVIKKQPGRIEFRVKPADGGIVVHVLTSAARDPIRNIKVWMPGFETSAERFHPLFLERLGPCKVLRFMDWQRTNGSPQSIWSQRAKLDDVRYSTDAGVPLEVMIDLANRLKVSPWFCLPHEADDDYVRNFAKTVRERLDPTLKVNVEYSNEVWNWGFKQTSYALERGKKLGLGAPEQHRFYAKRSVEVFAIFEEVFGGVERLVRILSGQFVNVWDCEQILTYQEAHRHADALAVGAYFGHEFGNPDKATQTVKLTPEQLIDQLQQEIDGPHKELLRKQNFLARKYGLRLLAYEGGQHLVGFRGAENNAELEKLLTAANRHPRMADLYQSQLKHWFAEGGSTFAVFSFAGRPSKWGSWGVLEHQDQPIELAPKYRAMADFSKGLSP